MAESVMANDIFGAIAAPSRRAMLHMLAQREMPVTELAESFEMTLSAVSQHLGILRGVGLVSQRKDGKQRYYRLNPEPLREISEWLSFYQPFWTDKLKDLGKYLDETEQKTP